MNLIIIIIENESHYQLLRLIGHIPRFPVRIGDYVYIIPQVSKFVKFFLGKPAKKRFPILNASPPIPCLL